jgi:pimeloyl-ACP methyl ester carboxylesterase
VVETIYQRDPVLGILADYALPHLVNDVTALINAATAKNIVLIGHNWGQWSPGVLQQRRSAE